MKGQKGTKINLNETSHNLRAIKSNGFATCTDQLVWLNSVLNGVDQQPLSAGLDINNSICISYASIFPNTRCSFRLF